MRKSEELLPLNNNNNRSACVGLDVYPRIGLSISYILTTVNGAMSVKILQVNITKKHILIVNVMCYFMDE